MTLKTPSKLLYVIITQKRYAVWLIFLLTMLLLVLYYHEPAMVIEMKHKYLISARPKPKFYQHSNKNKLGNKSILYWNTFFDRTDMEFGFGQDIFRNCAVSTCFTTDNKSLMAIENFDAIIFHGARYSVKSDGCPRKRSYHQKYIFFSLESPFNTMYDSSVSEDFYNWTMTYRRDSDIYYPYNLVQETKTNYTIPEFEDIAKRKGMVAWIVSNCETEGSRRRKKYADELSKHIPVDVYGACGNLTCPMSMDCYEMVETKYKFYLSFENSLCADYVTEKMYKMLKYNVIPVVLGYSDYKTIAPPNSVINVYDFDSPKALADYLYELSDNYEEYVKYFEWKKNYKIVDSKEYTLCQLCELLNEPLEYHSYSNIEDWYYGFKCVI